MVYFKIRQLNAIWYTFNHSDCPPDFFRCSGGYGELCFTREKECDGTANCNDGSDEASCDVTVSTIPTLCLPEVQFECAINGFCIPMAFWCDGQADCVDGSDEIECPTTVDPSKKVVPYNGICYIISYLSRELKKNIPPPTESRIV